MWHHFCFQHIIIDLNLTSPSHQPQHTSSNISPCASYAFIMARAQLDSLPDELTLEIAKHLMSHPGSLSNWMQTNQNHHRILWGELLKLAKADINGQTGFKNALYCLDFRKVTYLLYHGIDEWVKGQAWDALGFIALCYKINQKFPRRRPQRSGSLPPYDQDALVNTFIALLKHYSKSTKSIQVGQMNQLFDIFVNSNVESQFPMNLPVVGIPISMRQKLDTLELLFQNGADINKRLEGQSFDDSPLGRVVGSLEPEILTLCLQYGLNTNFRRFPGNDTLLHILAQENLAAGLTTRLLIVVRILADAGAPIDSTDVLNYTPFHRAVDHGNYGLAKFLVARGASINAEIPRGTIADLLTRDCRQLQPETWEFCRWAMDHGADFIRRRDHPFSREDISERGIWAWGSPAAKLLLSLLWDIMYSQISQEGEDFLRFLVSHVSGQNYGRDVAFMLDNLDDQYFGTVKSRVHRHDSDASHDARPLKRAR
ncbi:hypothetical protein BU16DRAFT_595142 [Lophium mytilinum]|uniref:Uncharacterized protein n=1 Tax=Lophium mytilinum TaxID=390894 RepID=A0A6A6QIL9_9PEZI|nr:hypothetical protein BU16DRAFT_595142 [Lophium mytilinum]